MLADVFLHGQVYVALSRVGGIEGVMPVAFTRIL